MLVNNKKVKLILSGFDTGAGKKGAKAGPAQLNQLLKQSGTMAESETTLKSSETLSSVDHTWCKNIETLIDNSNLLASEVEKALNEAYFPMVFSGDHSNAIGGLSGLTDAYPDKTIGVIWIDAHADLHSPYTTPSGNMHGMPLAALTATDNLSKAKHQLSNEEKMAWDTLKKVGSKGISPKIKPGNIAFIALRDAEPEEWSLIDEYGIAYFGPDDIKEHGIYYAINHALKKLEHCDGFYVSFDVDSMDPSLADGTGTPVDEGLSKTEAESVVKTLLNHPKTLVFEVTEINPSLDTREQKMAELTASVLQYALK